MNPKKSHTISQLSRFRWFIASCLVFVAFFSTKIIRAALPQTEEERERQRLAYFVRQSEAAKTDDAMIKDVLAAYKEHPAGTPMSNATMEKIYRAAGNDAHAFKVVAKIIQDGKIGDEHSQQMAALRDQWIDESIKRVAEKNNWKIARSDSGNTSSGMKSDLDQTFYVFEPDPDNPGEWRRLDTADGTFIEQFKADWQERGPPISLDALDVASIEGRNRFPDPRLEVVGGYHREYHRVIKELRATPGAYTTQGAVAQQMQFRALAAVLGANPRAYRIYEPITDTEGRVTYRKFPPDNIDDVDPDVLEKWQNEAVRGMFGVEPELMKGYAFGAGVANFLELLKYMDPKKKFESKYHLRTWEDCMQVLMLMRDKRSKRTKAEFLDMSESKRKRMNRRILDTLFGHNNPKRRRQEMAMQISADLRSLHKGKMPDRFPPSKNPKVQKRAVFGELGKELMGDRFDPKNESHIKQVDEAYRRLASEFCLEAVYRSAGDSFDLMVNPNATRNFVKGFNYMLRTKGGARLSLEEMAKFEQRLAEGARLTFLYAIYDLGKKNGAELIRRLKEKYPGHEVELYKLHAEAEAMRPKLREIIGMRWDAVRERVKQHFLTELGIERIHQADAINGILVTQNYVWNWRKYGRSKLNDPGMFDILAQILLTTVESEGDLGEIMKTVAREMFLDIPVIGQAASAAQGGVGGLVLIGLAMRFPPIGYVMMVYSVGSVAVEIYHMEVSLPLDTNLDNALYRGYVGPDLRDFGETPPMFRSQDMKEMNRLEREVGKAKLTVWYTEEKTKSRDPGLLAHYAPEHAEAALKVKQLAPRLMALKEKQARWNAYQKDREAWAWQGGAFTRLLTSSGLGLGAQPNQKPFSPSLLESISPMYAFLPVKKGAVDLTVLSKYETEMAQTELTRLDETRQSATDSQSRLQTDAQYHTLLIDSERHARAERYKKAMGRMPELLYKFRRDSLYPHFKDREGELDKFVDKWFDDNHWKLAELSVNAGLIHPPKDWQLDQIIEDMHPNHPYVQLMMAKERLKKRLHQDYRKSRTQYKEYERVELERRIKTQASIDEAVVKHDTQAIGIHSQDELQTPIFNAFTDSLATAAIKRAAPRLDTHLILTQHDKGKVTWGEKAEDPKYSLDYIEKITADPGIYPGNEDGKYKIRTDYLDRKEAEDALSSGNCKGLVLLPDAIKKLRAILKMNPAPEPVEGKGPPKDKEMLIILKSAFSQTMADLSDAHPDLRATVAHLPGQAPSHKTNDGHLMAQTWCWSMVTKARESKVASRKVKSSSKMQKVWIVITYNNVDPPRVVRRPGMVIARSGQDINEAMKKKLAEEQKKNKGAEVTLESR